LTAIRTLILHPLAEHGCHLSGYHGNCQCARTGTQRGKQELQCKVRSGNRLPDGQPRWAGYSEEAPSSQEEEELLTQLVNACFGSSEAENEELLRDVMALARAQGQCKESGVAAPHIQAVSNNVMEAVKDLKRQVAPPQTIRAQ
jgi:hypothetical protein